MLKRSLQIGFIALLAGVVVFGSSSALAARSSKTVTKNKRLNGTVVDINGAGLSGVSVSASGSSVKPTTNKKGKYSLNLSYDTSAGTTYTITYKKTGFPDTTLADQIVTKNYVLPTVTMAVVSPTSLEVKQLDANSTSLRWQYAGERTGVFFTIERKRTSVIPAVTGGFSTTPAVQAEANFSTVNSQEYALVYNDQGKIINGYGLIAGQTYAYRVKASSISYSNEATVTITKTNDGQWHDFAGATGSGTCTDTIKNGDETGIDTGGRCGTTAVTPPPPANDGTGTVSGTVSLNNGSSIVGQDVTIFLIKNDIYYSASVDTSGRFSSTKLQAGVYSVMVTSVSNNITSTYYPSSTYDAVVVTAGQTTSPVINNFALAQ